MTKETFSSKQLLLFSIGIHTLYFIAAFFFKGMYLVDSYGYIMQADNIRSLGTWYAEDWNAPLLVDYFSIRPPLYAWLLITLGTIWSNVYVVLFFQNVLSVFNLWLVYRYVKELLGETTRMQRFFMLGLVFYPAQMMHANFVMTEMVFQTILLLLFINLRSFIEKPGWKSSLSIVVLLSIALLTKPVSLFLIFVVTVISMLTVQWQRSNIRYVLPFVFVLVVLHSICLQNEHATGCYHYTSIKTINQLKYNARYTLVNARGEAYADSVMIECMRKANAQQNYGDRLNEMDADAMEIFKTYPASFLKIYVKGIAAFFLDPGRFDLYHFFAIEEKGSPGLMHEIHVNGWSAVTDYIKQAPVFALVLLAFNFCWNVFVVLCFIYFLISKHFPVTVRLILFMLVFYIAAATGPVGVSRYRVPVYPFLLIGVLATFAPKPEEQIESDMD